MTDTSNSTTKEFEYDVFGNLKEVTLPSKTINYLVDAHNRRVIKKENDNIVAYYIWNTRNQLIGIADGTGELQARFIYGSKSHVPDFMSKNNINYQIVTNHLGSPVSIVNASSGAVAQEIVWDEWGNVVSDSNPGFMPFGYAGCLYDLDTKLCRFGARDYDSSIGRWLSKDPILFAGGDTNLYGYVLQDPINLVDPSGLIPGDIFHSEGDAAADALNYINPYSIGENREYGGYIIKLPGGLYQATDPIRGSHAGLTLSRPPGATASYHTHGAFDPRYDNENFSQADIFSDILDRTRGYLDTPNGAIQVNDGGKIYPGVCK